MLKFGGNDAVVGDSFSPRGVAIGGGHDDLSGGPKNDLIVGDSLTHTGVATGTGNDGLHGLSGVDVLRGDNWASKPGGRATKGGRDLLTGGSGNDHLNGGPLRDDCSGGPGRDRASKCGGWVIEVP